MSGMSDPVQKIIDATQAMIDMYIPEDDSLENDAIVGYAMNVLETSKKELEAYKSKPLPEDDVWELAEDLNPHDPMYPLHFARAVERKHGIGDNNG
jgi:hypothetical protein